MNDQSHTVGYWTCGQCGNIVPDGVYHVCGVKYTVPVYTTSVGREEFYRNELQRVKAELEKIIVGIKP